MTTKAADNWTTAALRTSQGDTQRFWYSVPAVMLASAAGKLSHAAPLVENFGKFGFKEELLTPIGIMEALIAVLFIVPRTAFVGAILTTGYLGGAVCTHLRVSDAIFAPLILGILCWVGYAVLADGPIGSSRSLMRRMHEHRRLWMRRMLSRDNRIGDMQIVNILAQSNAFFASTSLLIIGGCLAVLGSRDQALEILNEIPTVGGKPPLVWELTRGGFLRSREGRLHVLGVADGDRAGAQQAQRQGLDGLCQPDWIGEFVA